MRGEKYEKQETEGYRREKQDGRVTTKMSQHYFHHIIISTVQIMSEEVRANNWLLSDDAGLKRGTHTDPKTPHRNASHNFSCKSSLQITGGFYSKRQRENDLRLWPCDLNATGGRVSENSISLLPFSRAFEINMCRTKMVVIFLSQSTQITGYLWQHQQIRKSNSTKRKFNCVSYQDEGTITLEAEA